MTDPHARLIAMAKAMMLQQGSMFPEVLRGLTPEQLAEHGWEDAVPIARAALTALAVPTPDMIEAAMSTQGMDAVAGMVELQAARGYPLPQSAFPGGVPPIAQAWSAMVKSVLGER